jgi:hypothetical protein
MRDYYLDVLKRGITAKGNIWLVPWVRVTPARTAALTVADKHVDAR